ncbi:MAG: methanogenesis marker 16 metalloprotein [Candidatus Lokiarchaeota archaeon]|nr:methanogenesis marker 16 metalloprotein [Candidatus Lokiarchaeota archaeon]
MEKKRKLSEIRKKIKENKAIVFTVQELLDAIANGEEVQFEDVDVITTATKGLMSGIAGIFSFRLVQPKTVRKFTEISLNGIIGFPGPCPNEYLGIIDLIVYGTGHSVTRDNYSGGTLFRDLVEGKLVEVVAKSVEGKIFRKEMTLEDMQFARLMGTRQAIKNYNAMINPTTERIDTIFSVLPFEPNSSQITFSGCGALNPFQNDPLFETFGVGMPVLVNGSIGHLIGPGTRNYVQKPNMMTIADFQGMKPEYMGSFNTSYGPEPICSIAVPIPILSESIFDNIVKSDNQIPLTILNLVGREKLGEITYGDVWNNNFLVKFHSLKCKKCEKCNIEQLCPTLAFNIVKGIDKTRCFNCGACVIGCKENAFECDLKTIKYDRRDIPIVLRQSDRHGAIKLAKELKKMILDEKFILEKPTGKLEFAKKMK